jgi:hypothetical protein
MSSSEPNRHDATAALLSLLREWTLLREREHGLVTQIIELLERRARGGVERGAAPDNGSAAEGGRVADGESRADGASGANGDGIPDGGGLVDAAGIGRPEAAPATTTGDEPPGDRSWIDRTIDAVLKGAFSSDSDPETDELPAVDLLLLRSGDTWVGVPWDNVAGLGLSDDAEAARRPEPLSLRVVLGMPGPPDGGDAAAEPYCLTWRTATGVRALCCEVLGGVVAAPAAAGRGVDLVWLPGDSATGGRLLPLVEYFATSRGAGHAEAEEKARAGDDLAESSASPHLSPGDAIPAPRPVPAAALETPPVSPPIPAPPAAAAPVIPPVSPPIPAPPAAAALEVPPASPPIPAPPAAAGLEVPPASPPIPAPAAAAGLPTDRAIPEPPAAAPGAPGLREAGLFRRPEVARVGFSRSPGRSALVAVRYLPARVAIARALRTRSWFVVEAADTDELPAMLRNVPHAVVFAESPERPAPGWMEALGDARDAGTRVIGVASRVRGASSNPLRALGDVPRLLYPFQEAELERFLEPPVPTDGR